MILRVVLLLLVPLGAAAANVGMTEPRGLPFTLAIWYPTTATAAPQSLGPYTETVAPDAPVAPGLHPLVVVSHGNGGSLASHYDTALALAAAGFVVAAPTHPGDNYRDHTGEAKLWNRPPVLRAAIDAVLHDWPGRASVDPARIGVFGFSAGGFTALAAIGGKPDFAKVDAYCAAHKAAFICTIRAGHPGDTAPAGLSMADPRIRAAVIAAPALGFTFGREGLAAVTVPVQLWAAADDQILPVADNAGAVRAALPHPPDYRLVPGAGHFDFLAPCPSALAEIAPPICTETHGFDRAAFHRQFNAAVVGFFTATLETPPQKPAP